MNAALAVMLRELPSPLSRFVFPSEAAASLWARRITELAGLRSVALNRFLAWDRFKEEVVRAEKQDRAPVPLVMRKLFVERLIQKNAAVLERRSAAKQGELPFRAIIPPAYAGSASVFVSSITAMLPSLSLWETLSRKDGGEFLDEEDRDFALLKKEYAEFLDQFHLFEPSWEKPPLRDRSREYFIFFPEAMEDFSEYETILSREANIHLVKIPVNEDRDTLYRYESVRAEIRGTILKIRAIHEKEGVPYEDMALSAARLEEIAPYLVRECSLYNIPVHFRSGNSLGAFGAGRLFSLMNVCAINNFSFASLKSLLLDDHIPWKDSAKNRELILFGIRNNCVSAYREKGREVDIWEEAFRSDRSGAGLRPYYKKLKDSLLGLVRAESFRDIRGRYFAFRGSPWGGDGEGSGGFLSRSACTPEADAVLARCVTELSALAELEERYPESIPPSPFSRFRFFLAVLDEKTYVPQKPLPGLNIFPYRVAAGAPYRRHFVLNASQEAATIQYRPLRFLRQDKKAALGISDSDASADFFRLYNTGSLGKEESFVRFSVSDQGFSGWLIPHSFFASRTIRTAVDDDDPFTEEKIYWKEGKIQSGAAFPSRLFSVQKEGFARWNFFLKTKNEKSGTAALLAREKLKSVQWSQTESHGSCARVSATDLNDFYTCPASWFFRKIFEIKEFSLEAKLLDDRSLGNLYHEILKNIFARIRREDKFFRSAHRELYKEWAYAYTKEAAENYPAFQGPLAAPLITAQAQAISRRLFALLKNEEKYFDGYTVGELENPFEFVKEYHDTRVLLYGKIDRVSVSPDGVPVIIDYKTGAMPSKKDSTFSPDNGIGDFQMALYMFLYETLKDTEAGGAFFVSVHKNDLGAVVGKPAGKRGHDREEYQATLDALDGYIDQFVRVLETHDFSGGVLPFKSLLSTCFGCMYKSVCRTTYFLNTQAPGSLTANESVAADDNGSSVHGN